MNSRPSGAARALRAVPAPTARPSLGATFRARTHAALLVLAALVAA